MLYAYYKLFVEERAGLRTGEESEKAIRSVFEVLDEMITVEQAIKLAETLPAEIRGFLGKRAWIERYDLGQFVIRIAEKEGIDQTTAQTHARAVLSVLAEFIPSPELLNILDVIPKEIRMLFNWMEKAA